MPLAGPAPCRRPRLTSNVRRHKETMLYASRVSAYRRELNSHNSAKPAAKSTAKAPSKAVAAEVARIRYENRSCTATGPGQRGWGTKDMEPK